MHLDIPLSYDDFLSTYCISRLFPTPTELTNPINGISDSVMEKLSESAHVNMMWGEHINTLLTTNPPGQAGVLLSHYLFMCSATDNLYEVFSPTNIVL